MNNTSRPDNGGDGYTVPARVRAFSSALQLAGVYGKVKRGMVTDHADVSNDTASRALKDARALDWLHRHSDGAHNHFVSNSGASYATGIARNEREQEERDLDLPKQLK